MSGRRPEERVRLATLRQRWQNVLFLHWPLRPGSVRSLLPDDLEPDLFDGEAWVSLTAFEVYHSRAGGVIPMGLRPFPETNLRTYVVGPDGRDGIFFFTLEVANAPSVLGGRGAGVPYRYAHMSIERRGDTITYRSRRIGDGDVGHDLVARPGGPLRSRGLRDDWLTGRWRAWTTIAGCPATVAVQHQAWELQHVELVRCHESLRGAHGLSSDHPPRLAHHAVGVDARLSVPRPLRRSTR